MLRNVDRITHGQLQEYMQLHYRSKTPVCIWGHSGIGKSEAVEKFAETRNMPCQTFLLSTTSPEELWGPQVYEPGQTRQVQLLPWWWPKDPTIIFLDELGGALEETRGSAFNFILRQEFAGHKLPEGSWVVGATNTNSDGSHHNQMGVPTLSRFGHVELVTDLEEWLEKAKSTKVRSDIRAFIRAYPNELFRHDGDVYAVEPRPRKWNKLSDILNEAEIMNGGELDLDSHVLRCATSGQVSVPTAEQFITFLHEARGSELSVNVWEASKKGHEEVRKIIDKSRNNLSMASVAAVMAGLPAKSFGDPKKLAECAKRTLQIVRAFAEFEIESEGQIPCIELSMASLDEVMDRFGTECPKEEEKMFESEDMRHFGHLMNSKAKAPEERRATMRRRKERDRNRQETNRDD